MERVKFIKGGQDDCVENGGVNPNTMVVGCYGFQYGVPINKCNKNCYRYKKDKIVEENKKLINSKF